MQAMIVHHLIIHEKQGDIFQKDLENVFQMRRSTATGILQLMEQHGIIRREPVEHDGRLKRLVLTEQARAMDEYITERMQQMEQLLRQGHHRGRAEGAGLRSVKKSAPIWSSTNAICAGRDRNNDKTTC